MRAFILGLLLSWKDKPHLEVYVEENLGFWDAFLIGVFWRCGFTEDYDGLLEVVEEKRQQTIKRIRRGQELDDR